MTAGHHTLLSGKSEELALVHDGGAYIGTNFTLGGSIRMDIEAVVLFRSTDGYTSNLFIGHGGRDSTSQTDSADYRLFFHSNLLYLDIGSGRGHSDTFDSTAFGAWHKVEGPFFGSGTTGSMHFDGSAIHATETYTQLNSTGYGVNGVTCRFFAFASSAASSARQKGCIRYVTFTNHDSGVVLADFRPAVSNGSAGIVDTVSGNFYTSSEGTLSVVPWKQVSETEAWQ